MFKTLKHKFQEAKNRSCKPSSHKPINDDGKLVGNYRLASLQNTVSEVFQKCTYSCLCENFVKLSTNNRTALQGGN